MIALSVDAYAHEYMTHLYGMHDMIDSHDAYISHM